MCKSRTATEAAEPVPSSRASSETRVPDPVPVRVRVRGGAKAAASGSSGSSDPSTTTTTTDPSWQTSSALSSSSRASLSSLRGSLPENPHIYAFSEIRAATNNFLAKRYSTSSAACWRCSLRDRDAIVFQRRLRRSIDTARLRERLSVVCRSHHVSVVNLLGVSISGADIYLVYDFVAGANLANCLRNPRNPGYTVLSTWASRMQVAADLAHGLDYFHNNAGLNMSRVHNHIKSSSVIVTEPSFNARICHFGTAELCGEAAAAGNPRVSELTEFTEEKQSNGPKLERSGSGSMQFDGVREYMSPEFKSTGVGTQKSDVFAFGVVILELLSGEQPLKFRFDRARHIIARTSVIDTARAAIEGGDGDDSVEVRERGRQGRLRRWVDRRLNDSFPVEGAEKLTRLALECVHPDPAKRPEMGRVAGKISKLYLESGVWSDSVQPPTGISVSFAPR